MVTADEQAAVDRLNERLAQWRNVGQAEFAEMVGVTEAELLELITQAEAARLAGITTQAVHNATRDGRLETYANDDATNPRHGGKLVSRQQVQAVWAA